MIPRFLKAVFRRMVTKRHANCSFCRKSYREVGPLAEGPHEVYSCGDCAELTVHIIAEEKRRRDTALTSSESHDEPSDRWNPPKF